MTNTTPQWFRRQGLALLTDFYELTMIAGQIKEGRSGQHVAFDYFFRALPPHAGFAVAAGLDQFLSYLENLRFEQDDIDYLRSMPMFDDEFFDFLSDFRPGCTVRAVPEGTLVFPYEPVIQVEGDIVTAQLVETALLNFVNYATLIATKAARTCLAAEGEPVLEFGLRRAHGPDGGITASRAAYIGGCTSTSNVLAGKVYGIPVAGTHAHSWVMSFPNELEAFRAFTRNYPEKCVLLVDTYDTIESGVPNAIKVFTEMREAGHPVRPAIRLDSGDLAKLSKKAYQMMVQAGLDDPLIVASNDLDEDIIADLKRQGAKINAWGVGTHMITSYDCPALSGVYKLVALNDNGRWQPRIKLSANIEKSTDPGRKRIVRYYDDDNHPIGDLLVGESEKVVEHGPIHGRDRLRPHVPAKLVNAARAEELLETVFENGEQTGPVPAIEEIRSRTIAQIAAIPEEFKRLRNPELYRVLLSESIGQRKAEMLEDPGLA